MKYNGTSILFDLGVAILFYENFGLHRTAVVLIIGGILHPIITATIKSIFGEKNEH